MTKKPSIRAGIALANSTFDQCLPLAEAARLDAYCELRGHALRFLPRQWVATRPRNVTPMDHVEKTPALPIQYVVEVWETATGGVREAVHDPLVARLMPLLAQWGGRGAAERLETVLRGYHNSEHKKLLGRKDDTEQRKAESERDRIRSIVGRGQAWINESIAQDRDARELDVSAKGLLPSPPSCPLKR